MPFKSALLILTALVMGNATRTLCQIQAIINTGDIIFQTSTSAQSIAIQLATQSKFIHVGIVYKNKKGTYVFEAIQPVKMTPLDVWIKRGQGAHYVVKRLADEHAFTANEVENLTKYQKQFEGKNYDLYFSWSDSDIYCSELVWKIYKQALGIELCKLQQLKDFDLSSSVVQTKLKERYGALIPLDEKVVSPAAIFVSDKLKTVVER